MADLRYESTTNRTEDSSSTDGPGAIVQTREHRARLIGRRIQRTMNRIDSTISAVGAGPARRISHWPAPGWRSIPCKSRTIRVSLCAPRQGGIIVTGKKVFPEFLKLTAQQKAVRVTDSQRFEERDCRVGSPCGYGRRCIGAIQASRRVATKTRVFHFSHIA